MSKIRMIPVVSALILTFSLLFGGLQLYRSYGVIKPLQEQLRNNDSVAHFSISLSGSVPEVQVALKSIPDLQTTYLHLQDEIVHALGSPVNISLQDHRNTYLLKTYEQMQPILYQDIAHGDYMDMMTTVQQFGKRRNVELRITLNAQDIFIQMARGTAYLYEVIPYKNALVGGGGS